MLEAKAVPQFETTKLVKLKTTVTTCRTKSRHCYKKKKKSTFVSDSNL